MKAAGTSLNSVLVGTDFSVCSARALAFAVTLAKPHSASLHLLHVLMEPVQSFDIAAALPYPDSSARKDWENAAVAHLEKEVKAIKKRGLEASFELQWGRPSDVIIQTAIKKKVSLIVLGTHGRSALEKLLLGSTAERVVRLSPIPVLTVREKR